MTHPKLASVKSGYGGRGYKIPGREFIYPSVTTVLKQHAKPNIEQWIADQTAAKAVVSIPQLMQRTNDVGYQFLRFAWRGKKTEVGTELRQHWELVRDDAASLGTNIHEWIEASLGHGNYPDNQTVEVGEMIEMFLEWLDDHEVDPVHIEATVVNDEDLYAGTGDAWWWVKCNHIGECIQGASEEAKLVLVDVKSGRFTGEDARMQLAALGAAGSLMVEVDGPGSHPLDEDIDGPIYTAQKHEKVEKGVKIQTWWIEIPAPKVDSYAILHIRPDDLGTKGEPIARFCRLVEVHDIDLYYMGFKGLRMTAEMSRLAKENDRKRGVEIETE